MSHLFAVIGTLGKLILGGLIVLGVQFYVSHVNDCSTKFDPSTAVLEPGQ